MSESPHPHQPAADGGPQPAPVQAPWPLASPPPPGQPGAGISAWRRRPVLTAAGVALVAVLGAAAASAVATLLVLWQADDIGERIGAGAGQELGRAQEEATERILEMEEEYYSGESYGWSTGGSYAPSEVEQFPPTPPGTLGADPELDQYALECFEGDLDSCDDLFAESPPLSAYEEYASTCGGRVKQYSAPYCTDLE